MSTIVDFAEMLRDIINDKIKECKDIHESHSRIDTDRLMIEIHALEWVQGRIQNLVIDNVTTDWPVYNDDDVD